MIRNLSSLLALSMIGAAAFAAQALAQDTVTAVKADKPPNLAAGASDPAWTTAQPHPALGRNELQGRQTTATIKALHAGDMLYMLVQYDDPTKSDGAAPSRSRRTAAGRNSTTRMTRGATTTNSMKTSSR